MGFNATLQLDFLMTTYSEIKSEKPSVKRSIPFCMFRNRNFLRDCDVKLFLRPNVFFIIFYFHYYVRTPKFRYSWAPVRMKVINLSDIVLIFIRSTARPSVTPAPEQMGI